MWLQKLKNAMTANKALLATAQAEKRALTEDEQKTFDDGLTTIENCKKQLANEENLANIDAELATVVNKGEKPVVPSSKDKPEQVYKNFSSFLIDVKNASTGSISKKLGKLQNTLGMNEGVGSDGGFGVQPDFAGMILESAVKESGILSRVDNYQISGNANRVEWVDIDEDDISDGSVAGGVKAYWASEASTVEASQPKLKSKELKLEKLMGICYTTYELDADSNFTDQLITRSFTTAINRALESAIVSGDGIGKPTGILTGGGVVTVAKESGQDADTIVWENIRSMYHRAINPSNGKHVWLVHPDAHEQLDSLKVEVGTGGVPVYQPAAMTGAVPTLRGIPVISTDQCSALGTKGDIILADLSDYILPFKDGVQKDVSIHVQFLSAQNAFRFILRVNGRPKTTNTLKIKNSAKLRGKYITIADRA